MVVIFSGPTLAPDAAKRLFPEARCLSPAAQGDVYRACQDRPAVICLIDGYFEHQPAVTHKELLWTLHSGVLVYGASSMGALRAAEMSAFGMRGWGKVFEMFATGELEDDDEVAVVHADADRGFAPSSEALVNVRLTLKAASAARVLSRAAADTLIAHAKAFFYPDRQYPRILHAAREAGLSRSEVAVFERWLSAAKSRVDQKLQDAATLLSHLRHGYLTESFPQPPRATDFPYTEAWHELRAAVDQSSNTQPETEATFERSTLADDLLEEIQLLGPETFQRVLSAATWRALCVDMGTGGDPQPLGPRSPALDRVPERPSQKWLVDHDLGPESHRRLIEDERHVARINALARRRVLSEIPNVLTLLGDYPKVRARAREKRLYAGSARRPSDPEVVKSAVRAYFEGRLGRAVPEDMGAFARSAGFASCDEFEAAIWRDAEFVRSRQ